MFCVKTFWLKLHAQISYGGILVHATISESLRSIVLSSKQAINQRILFKTISNRPHVLTKRQLNVQKTRLQTTNKGSNFKVDIIGLKDVLNIYCPCLIANSSVLMLLGKLAHFQKSYCPILSGRQQCLMVMSIKIFDQNEIESYREIIMVFLER